jgi:biofilm protein TabA
MIYDHIAQHALYHSLGPRFKLGLEYLAGYDASTPLGRVTLDGDNVFALVQGYETSLAAGRVFESHRIYVDIQFVAAGEELIFTAPWDRLLVTTPYTAANDAAFYSGPDDTPLRMRAGDFCLLFPQDGHKPCCQWTAAGPVKKVVVKVRL